jgi:hypothetical protein
MTYAFSQEYLDRIQEAHDRIMAEESVRVARSVELRLRNFVTLLEVAISFSSSYKVVGSSPSEK